MKYCPFCGAVLPDEKISFCLECGENLTVLNQHTETEKPAKKTRKEKKKEKKETKEKKRKKLNARKNANRMQSCSAKNQLKVFRITMTGIMMTLLQKTRLCCIRAWIKLW